MAVKTKKAALCLFGQARTLDRCYPYLKKNLLDPIGKNKKDYDIFCCVEDDGDSKKIKLLNPTKVLKIKSSDAEKTLKKKIDFLERNNYVKFIATINSRTPTPTKNILHLLYKKRLCYNLLEEEVLKNKTKYKYFVRARFDLVPIDKIELEKLKINPDEVFVPENKEMEVITKDRGIDDCFCVTSSIDSFGAYCKMIDNICNLIIKHHSIDFSFFQKTYFKLEKAYKKMLIYLFRDNKNFNLLFDPLAFIPEVFFYRKVRKKKIGNHVLLFNQLKSNGRKIKKMKMNYALIRKDYKGLLRVE